MRCPVCPTTTLAIAERHGVEIDYCPDCRGVWLDRGELDKLIERAEPPPGGGPSSSGRGDHRRDGDRRYDRDGDGRRPRRKESFLGDLFDFGG